MSLAEAIAEGDRRALARGLTFVENQTAEAATLLADLPLEGKAHRVGFTGPPGAGKSTLVSALTAAWRQEGRRVGVLAVDPSSPFTGGALLGDRIRMLSHSGDDGVFIRSLASRGALGGLSAAVYDAADLLDAGGFDPVLIETVGVGQGEVEICGAADTTVVVLAPGAGDVVQGMKAGLVEIADILVLNQSDRAGADALEAALRNALELSGHVTPPIVRTVATGGDGIAALRALIDTRTEEDAETLGPRRRQRAQIRLRAAVDRHVTAAFWAAKGDALAEAARAVVEGRLTPSRALEDLLGGRSR